MSVFIFLVSLSLLCYTHSAEVSNNSESKTLRTTERVYEGVHFMSSKDHVVTFVHDGGIAKIDLDKLPELDLKAIKEFFGKKLSDKVTTTPGNVVAGSSNTQIMPARQDRSSPGTKSDANHEMSVYAEASGIDSDEAVKQALREAVRVAVGSFISSQQVVENDEVIKDQIISYSDAFVSRYQKVKEESVDGLINVKILATIVKAKLADRLKDTHLISEGKVDGEGMFAESLSQADRLKSACALLGNLFEAFPEKLCRVDPIGQTSRISDAPGIISVHMKARISVDDKAYASWCDEATTVLEQVCIAKTPINIPAANTTKASRPAGEDFSKYTDSGSSPSAEEFPGEIRFDLAKDAIRIIPDELLMNLGSPKKSLKIAISKTHGEISGYIYELEKETAEAILKKISSDIETFDSWKQIRAVKVDFFDGKKDVIFNSLVQLTTRHSDDMIGADSEPQVWAAPYSQILTRGRTITFPPGAPRLQARLEDNRVLLVQPGFLGNAFGMWLWHIYHPMATSLDKSDNTNSFCTRGFIVSYKLDVPEDILRRTAGLKLNVEGSLSK